MPQEHQQWQQCKNNKCRSGINQQYIIVPSFKSPQRSERRDSHAVQYIYLPATGSDKPRQEMALLLSVYPRRARTQRVLVGARGQNLFITAAAPKSEALVFHCVRPSSLSLLKYSRGVLGELKTNNRGICLNQLCRPTNSSLFSPTPSRSPSDYSTIFAKWRMEHLYKVVQWPFR